MSEKINDIFISYKSCDLSRVQSLYDRLENDGYKLWMAPNSIPPGSSYSVEINKAIKESKCVLLFMTNNVFSSKWVSKELDTAINNELLIIPWDAEEIDEASYEKAGFKFQLSDIQREYAYLDEDKAYRRVLEHLSQNGIFSSINKDENTGEEIVEDVDDESSEDSNEEEAINECEDDFDIDEFEKELLNSLEKEDVIINSKFSKNIDRNLNVLFESISRFEESYDVNDLIPLSTYHIQCNLENVEDFLSQNNDCKLFKLAQNDISILKRFISCWCMKDIEENKAELIETTSSIGSLYPNAYLVLIYRLLNIESIEAEDLFDYLLKTDIPENMTLYYKGLIELHVGDKDKALPLFTKVLKDNPMLGDYCLGKYYMEIENDYDTNYGNDYISKKGIKFLKKSYSLGYSEAIFDLYYYYSKYDNYYEYIYSSEMNEIYSRLVLENSQRMIIKKVYEMYADYINFNNGINQSMIGLLEKIDIDNNGTTEYFLGCVYDSIDDESGYGYEDEVTEEYKQAGEYYKLAYQKGNPFAAYMLGKRYDDMNAIKYAAESGVCLAANYAYAEYLEKLNDEDSLRDALNHYMVAAEVYGNAMRKVSYFYEMGIIVKQDYKKALEWLKKSCEDGVSLDCNVKYFTEKNEYSL